MPSSNLCKNISLPRWKERNRKWNRATPSWWRKRKGRVRRPRHDQHRRPRPRRTVHYQHRNRIHPTASRKSTMCYFPNPDKRFLAIQFHPNPIVPVPSGHQGTAALPRQGATAAGPFLLQVLEMFAPKRTLRRINQKAHKSCRRVLCHSSCRHVGDCRPSKAQETPGQAMNGNRRRPTTTHHSRLSIARCSSPGTRNRCRPPVAGLPLHRMGALPNHHHERNG